MAGERSVLITGCSSGIGYAAAHYLSRRGYQVFATARKPEDVARLRGEGLESLALDLDDPESIRAAVADVLEATGGHLYGLFNNGGFAQPGAVEDLSRDVLRAQLETNLLGWLDLTNRILPVMRRQGEGRVIQNSSVLGLVALPLRGAYNCSKHALEGLTGTLRLELAGTGIHVSLIEPGPIRSRIRANAYEKLKANIDMEASPFRERYRASERRLMKTDDVNRFTLPPEAVAKKLVHALESRRPKPRYYVTVPTHLLSGLKRILSTRRLDALLQGVGRAEQR